MSDDASYSSFLDKANQDTGVSKTNSAPKSPPAPQQKKMKNVPATLQKIDAYYTSDTDEPFEPVSFDYNDSSPPTAQDFEKLVAKAVGNAGPARAEELSHKEFDPRDQYHEVLEVVEGETDGGGVKIFRVSRGKTRAEYYVVGLRDGMLVGVKAKAVES